MHQRSKGFSSFGEGMFRALQENLNQESFEKINRRERQWRSKNYKLGGGGKKILVIKKSSEKI